MSLELQIRKQLDGFTLNAALGAESSPMGLLGASGSGKSLTLKSIAGIIRPDSGTIRLNGRTLFDSEHRIDLPPQKRRVGYLFQTGALFPHMTVAQNMACGLPEERNKEKKRAAVANMIEAMRLSGLEQRKPAQLSGGERQRAALGRILIGKPELLLLDEPFSGLDGHLKDGLMEELGQTLQGFDRQVLLVTHAPEEAYALCQSLAIMEGGCIVSAGETGLLFQKPNSRAGAILTGCKNVADAVKWGERCVFVPSWNLTLKTEESVEDGLVAVGVHAHAFSQTACENLFPVRVEGVREEPMHWLVQFRFIAQTLQGPPLYQRIPKNLPYPGGIQMLGIAPKDILLLYA